MMLPESVELIIVVDNDVVAVTMTTKMKRLFLFLFLMFMMKMLLFAIVYILFHNSTPLFSVHAS